MFLLFTPLGIVCPLAVCMALSCSKACLLFSGVAWAAADKPGLMLEVCVGSEDWIQSDEPKKIITVNSIDDAYFPLLLFPLEATWWKSNTTSAMSLII